VSFPGRNSKRITKLSSAPLRSSWPSLRQGDGACCRQASGARRIRHHPITPALAKFEERDTESHQQTGEHEQLAGTDQDLTPPESSAYLLGDFSLAVAEGTERNARKDQRRRREGPAYRPTGGPDGNRTSQRPDMSRLMLPDCCDPITPGREVSRRVDEPLSNHRPHVGRSVSPVA
jgi:hypothetical protein